MNTRIPRPTSMSQDALWRKCRRAWWYRYAARATEPNPVGIELSRGIVLHAAMEAVYGEAQRAAPGEWFGKTMYQAFGRVALAVLARACREAKLDDYEFDLLAEYVLEALKVLPVPVPSSILAVEHAFEIGNVRGKIDLVLRTGPNSIHLRDWKSYTPTGEAGADRQLALYVAAARLLWPWATEITVGLYGVRKRVELIDVVDLDYSSSVLADLNDGTDDMDDALEEATQPGANPGEIFAPAPQPDCVSCVFRSYCPAFSGPAPVVDNYPEDDLASTRNHLEKLLEPLGQPA